MPSKKKMQFYNIIKEFGFPTSIRTIENTYKSECLLEGSELWNEAKDFEQEFNEELEKQNSNSPQYGKEQNADRYYRFEDIFLKHQKIFDSELYLLQMSVLMERDNSTKKIIRRILEEKGIPNATEDIIDALFVKDNNTISNLIQMFCVTGMNVKEAMKVAQFLKSDNLSTPNVYLPPSNKRNLDSLMNTIKNRLINSDVSIIEVFKPNLKNEDKTPTFNFNVINSQVNIGNTNFLLKKEKENQKRYDEARGEIDLDAEIQVLAPYDLSHIFRYKNLGVLFSDFLYNNALKRGEAEQTEVYSKEILDTVRNNLKYIDFDKLLLSILQAEYDKYGEDLYRFSYEEVQKLKRLSDKVRVLLENPKIEMTSDRFLETITFEKISASIDALNNSYIAGEFYSEEEINYLAQEYLSGKKDVKTLTPHEFKNVLRFTDGEILAMLKRNPDLLEYLIRNNIMEEAKKEKSDKDIRLFELIEKQGKISNKQLQILYDNKKLTAEYLRQLYIEKNKIDIEDIKFLKVFVPEEFFEDMVSTSELVELYLDKENQKERFNKYKNLYKLIKIDEKSIEEKNDLSNEILDQNLELLKEESIMELYTLGLITIDTVIDFTGGNIVEKLYLANELKPIDAKRLFYSGIITEDMLKAIMVNPTIDEGKKITLLYSTFPEIEDTEIMRNLEVYLREIPEGIQPFPSSSSKKTSDSRNRNKTEENTSENQFRKLKKAYEPRAKYRLLSIIDKEYEFKYNEKDGTAIFYFPNRDEYVIEKLYDKERKPATNVATYILSKDAYEQNKDKFYQEGRINISNLYALKLEKAKGVKRFIHTGWANSIIKYYDLDNQRKYSREQILEIQRLAEQVEKSKKEVER